MSAFSAVNPKGKSILCLMSFGHDHPIEAKIAKGLNEAVIERGYTPIVGVAPIDPREEVRRLVEEYGASLAGIAVQPYRPTLEVAEMLFTSPTKNIPHILIGHYYSDLRVNACVIDNFGGMYAVTEHLIRSGRKRPCYVGEMSLSSTEHERFLGFTMACVHNGIQVPKGHYVDLFHTGDLRVRFEELFNGDEPPDAFVSLYDTLGLNVMRVLSEMGIDVPGDVAVMSFGDDEGLAEAATPTLSTGFHPSVEMGAVAGHQLINMIEGVIPRTPQVHVVPVQVHVRQSCGAVAQGRVEDDSYWSVPFSGYIGREARLEEVSGIHR